MCRPLRRRGPDIETGLAHDATARVAQTATVSRSIAGDIALVNATVADIRRGGEQVQTSAGELSRFAEGLKALTGQFKA